MKQTLMILLAAAFVVAVSCGKNEKQPAAEAPAVAEAAADDLAAVAGDDLAGAMSMDDYEHKFPKEWRNHTIEVTGQKGKGEEEPDIKAILDAIVEVFPLPMLVQWGRNNAGTPAAGNKKAEIYWDQDNFFIGGCWKDPMGNFDDHFELKAWQVNIGTWLVGLNYQPLWDGDDGVGVYGNQVFWWYAPKGDANLFPIEYDEDHPRLPDDGDPHFDREENTISFPGSPDPASDLLHFNGWWFVHW